MALIVDTPTEFKSTVDLNAAPTLDLQAATKLYVDQGDNTTSTNNRLKTKIQRVTATTNTGTTSSTFVNFSTNITMTFAKQYASPTTHLLIQFDGALYNNDALGQYELGVQVGATDYAMANGFAGTGPQSASYIVTGLAIATHTITMRRRRPNGAGTVLEGQGTAQVSQLTVSEIWAP